MSFHRRTTPVLPLAHGLEPEAMFGALDDVIAVKTAMSALDYYDPQGKPMTPTADSSLWEAIEAFQTDRGLKVDGIIRPGGETAREIGRLLVAEVVPVARRRRRYAPADPSQREKPYPSDECDDWFYDVELPVCDRIRQRYGPAVSAVCYHTAFARYSACIAGKPMSEWPPLVTSP